MPYCCTDPDPGNYMVNFHAQPPGQRQSSGFCIVAKNGQLRNFQFDAGFGPGNGGGGNNFGGASPNQAMQLCKDTASARLPNVPLAYIQVNRPSVNGGSMLSTFRANPPDGPYASGSCDVFKNGRVNLSFNH
jgi:hypothetical protein